MRDKLVQLRPKARRVNYKGLHKLFARAQVKRELEPVRKKELALHPVLDGMEWYTARYAGPGDDYRELGAFPLRGLGLGPELLVYRILRDLYGVPDIITVALPKDEVPAKSWPLSGFPSEWAFMLKGPSLGFIEIRRQPGTQDPHLALWVPKLHDVKDSQRAEVQKDLDAFVAELKKTIAHSRHLVENRAVKASAVTLGPFNVYADMMASGDEQLDAAVRLKSHYKVALSKRDRSLPGPSLGTFYLAAAVNYLLALEAFVNTLSQVLRKESFSNELFDRATVRADFEVRLLTLSLYCDGFERLPFSPDRQEFEHIRQLREFRNNLLHGNLSHDDHVIHIVPEDHFLFYWWPVAEHGYLADGASSERLPLSRVLFSKTHADGVKKHVEAAVDLIVNAMTPEFKQWTERWRFQQIVPAVFKDGRWIPSLKGAVLR